MNTDRLLDLRRAALYGNGRLSVLDTECITIFRDLILELIKMRPPTEPDTVAVEIVSRKVENGCTHARAGSLLSLWLQCADCRILTDARTHDLAFVFEGTEFALSIQPSADAHKIEFSCANEINHFLRVKLRIACAYPERAVCVPRLCDERGELIRRSETIRCRDDFLQSCFDDLSYLHPLIDALIDAATDYWRQFPYQRGDNVSSAVIFDKS